MISSIPAGQVWATLQVKYTGLFMLECGHPPGSDKLTWQPANSAIDKRTLIPAFAAELKAAGLVAADDPDNLFQKNRGEADIQVAGNIKNITANLCLGYKGGGVSFTIGAPSRQIREIPDPTPDFDGTYGDITLDVEWQVYSASADKVIADLDIKSTYSITGHAPGNYAKLLQGGLRENFKTLIASSDFRRAATTAPVPAAFRNTTQPTLVLASTKTSSPTKISDAVGSVMVIFSGGGHGSGFLVSSDGYVMTAAHVVGPDKFVKVRWSDGLEGVGEVVRADTRRDAALIKVDPRGRQPLKLRRDAPQPGDTVFAIGAPLDVKYQSTVTRGVASANRIMDGFSFIQSDVTINPGNSGGPLLDEKGEVIGICDLTFRPDGGAIPTGINYFVPIDDALRFLSAEPR
jgi:S1-C subfamily serine protease